MLDVAFDLNEQNDFSHTTTLKGLKLTDTFCQDCLPDVGEPSPSDICLLFHSLWYL